MAFLRLGSHAPPPVRYELNTATCFAAMCFFVLFFFYSVSAGVQALKGQQVSPARGIICHIFNKRYSSKPGQETLSDLVH